MGLCVFDVYEKYYNSKTGGMSNSMGKNPYPPSVSPQGVKCMKSIAVLACVWLPPFLFLIFYFSVVCYKQLVQFFWLIFHDSVDSIFLLAPHSQHIQTERRTFYCVRVFGIFFQLSYCCFAYKIKSWFAENHGHFLKFCC